MNESTPSIKNILKMADGDPNAYDKLMENFKVSCPVKKINLTEDSPAGIAGMCLLTAKDFINLIKEKADLSDLDDNTILFFTNQHLVEMANVIYGMLKVIEMCDGLQEGAIYEAPAKFIQLFREPISYKKFKQKIYSIGIFIRFKEFCKYIDIQDKIRDILLYLPFVSYSDLDEIAIAGIEDYMKQKEGKNND